MSHMNVLYYMYVYVCSKIIVQNVLLVVIFKKFKCVYYFFFEFHRVFKKYIKLFFNMTAVESSWRFRMSWDKLLYTQVTNRSSHILQFVHTLLLSPYSFLENHFPTMWTTRWTDDGAYKRRKTSHAGYVTFCTTTVAFVLLAALQLTISIFFCCNVLEWPACAPLRQIPIWSWIFPENDFSVTANGAVKGTVNGVDGERRDGNDLRDPRSQKLVLRLVKRIEPDCNYVDKIIKFSKY